MATRLVRLLVIGTLIGQGVFAVSSVAFAQPPTVPPPGSKAPPPVYNGIIAGWEAYFRGETERQQAIGSQLSAIDTAGWFSGFPTTVPYPPDLETTYAAPPSLTGWPGCPGRPGWPGRPGQGYAHPGCSGIFEPWPLVPNDLYTPFIRRVSQPIGNLIIPLGPNGYFARSVFPADKANLKPPGAGPPVAPPPAEPGPNGVGVNGPVPPPVPGAVAPQPPAEVPATPVPENVPAPAPDSSGPREF